MRISVIHKLLEFIRHPALLALPVAVIIAFTLPEIFEKYTLKHISEQILESNFIVEYYDLDHDGISEYYYAGDNNYNGSCVAIYTPDGPLFHWDFKGSYLPKSQKCITGDTDYDGIDEVYAFTLSGDSLLMNGIDLRKKGEFIVSNRFLFTIPVIEDGSGVVFSPIAITEMNGDRRKEIVFAISAGYGLIPRRVFAYDLAHDTLLASPELGGHATPFSVKDIDNDDKLEITFTNYGPGNLTDKTLPMQDTCAYLIVLDNDLKFMFTPVPMPGRYNGMQNQFINIDSQDFLLSYWGYYSQSKENPSLRLYDLNGTLIRSHEFPYSAKEKAFVCQIIPFRKNQNLILFLPRNGIPQVYNVQFQKLDYRLPATGCSKMTQIDLDLDGYKEFVYKSDQPGKWVILSNNLKNATFFNSELSSSDTPLIYHVLKKGNSPQFCFQINNHQYKMEYGFNPRYYWQYPVYLAIYLLVLGFILLIRKIQRIQLQQKYEIEKRMAELQLLSIRNQMDPHFTFNVLNTIGSTILQKKSDESYDLLMKFSKMIRTTIHSSSKICRPLKEELDFVKNYLELQQIRHQGYFKFSISVDPAIDQSKPVPKMVLQTYVENALKHGLIPKKNDGLIQISAIMNARGILLTIKDNGIGRKKASQSNTVSTKVGLKIMQQYYAVLNKQNTCEITEEITDLYFNGEATGTLVSVWIPDDFIFPD